MRKLLLCSTAVGAIAATYGLSLDQASASPLGSPACTQVSTSEIDCSYSAGNSGDFSAALPINLFQTNLGALGSVLVVELLSISGGVHAGQFTWVASPSVSTTTTANETVTSKLSVSSGPTVLLGASVLSVTATQGISLVSGTTGTVAFNASNLVTEMVSGAPLSEWESTVPMTRYG